MPAAVAADVTRPAPTAPAVAVVATAPAPVVVLTAPAASSDASPSATPARNDDTPPWAMDDAPVRAKSAPVSASPAVSAPEAARAAPAAVVAPQPVAVAPEAAVAPPVAAVAPALAADAAPAVATPSVTAVSAASPTSDPSVLLDDGQIADAEQWLELVTRSGLNGPSRQLAANAAFVSHRDGVLRLALAPGFEYLNSERSIANLAQALAPELGNTPRIVIETGSADVETLHERANRQKGERQSAAETAFMNDRMCSS